MMETLWLPVFLLLVSSCHSARILVFQTTNARSHSVVMEPLYEELAARGHELTVFTSFPHKPPVPNLHEVDVSYVLPPVVSNFSFDMIRKVMPNPFETPIFMTDLEFGMCEKILPEAPIRKLLESNKKFDLVMAEIFAVECYVPFSHKFNAPLISFVTSSVLPWSTDRFGLPDNPSYIPNYLVDFSPDMTFYERLYNTVVLGCAKLLYKYYTLPKTQCLVNKYIGESFPSVDTLVRNTSFFFVNSHFSLAMSRPFPPNVVEIGGIHIRNSSKTLPKDIQNILDQSPQGVILMSFGSLVRVSSIPKEIIQMFLKVFSKIPQKVIFKYEDNLPDLPPNVVTRKWLPQREIIEHKNVKVFLGHGGLASTIEAVHFGKPLIGIPFFADQYLNVKALARRGAGVMLDVDNLSEKSIEAAIKAVLNDPKYTENMRHLSRQFRDRPQSALQSAVFWTEYVIRHQGAHHLRPASVNLAFYQYLLLDVLAVLLLPVLAVLYLFYFLFFRAVEVSPNDHRNYVKLKKDD